MADPRDTTDDADSAAPAAERHERMARRIAAPDVPPTGDPATEASRAALRRMADRSPITHVGDVAAHAGEPITASDGGDQAGPWLGVRVATVADVQDPHGLGRVEVVIPPRTPPARSVRAWARVATLMAGPDRGTWFLPAVGEEVLVAFEDGDVTRPCIVGALWGPGAPPPVAGDDADDVRLVRSRAGTEVLFDDGPAPRLVLRTASGTRIELDEDAGSVIVADTNGNEVVLDGTGISIDAASTVRIDGSIVEVVASVVKFEAGMVQCSGVVQAQTVIADTVVANTVTPSAGNVW